MGIFDIFSNKDAQDAAAAQTAAIEKGYSQLSDLYGQGSNALQTNYANALKPLTENFRTANAGVDQLAALLGLKPGSNMSDVLNTLKSLPGYQFALDQGSQNVLRNQAATGQLNSGGTNIDLMNYGQGLASQNYNNYVSQLQPYLGMAQNTGGQIAGVNTGLGNALNTNLTNQGNAALSANTAIGNAQAQADYAKLAQSGAIWGGVTGLASSALKGGGGGGGGGGGSFFPSLSFLQNGMSWG